MHNKQRTSLPLRLFMRNKQRTSLPLRLFVRNMQRTILPLLLCALALLAGCAQQEPPALEQVEYSNLTDLGSRALLSDLLAAADIEARRTTALLARVDRFNGSVRRAWLTDGFERAATTETKYDPYEMQEMWSATNGSFVGHNCRITAFGLFGGAITADADQPEAQGEDALFLDLETLAADPGALCGGSTASFCALFAPVEAADSTETKAQVKALRDGWAARGVTFQKSKASLISVVFQDKFSEEDNTLFIGHVGVLLPAEDGTLCFVEKVAFQEPYRLVKLADRTALSDYLMARYDTAWDQETTRPFVMENDALMKGYRPNPLSK